MNKRLVTNPEFDGREKEFLRAQIARITYATTLGPDGLYDKEEDGNNLLLKDEEGRDVKGTLDLNSHESWVWMRPGLLPSGLLKAKEVDEDAEDADANKDNREQTIERLLKIEADRESWKLSLQGLTDNHKIDNADVNYGVNVISSVRWPGAMTVA